MELSRGICVLCTNNTKVIVPPQAEDKTSLIMDILVDHIDSEKFEEINTSLKVCPLCLHDILTVAKLRQNIKEGSFDSSNHCTLCHREKHLVRIGDWSHFDVLLENIKPEKRFSKCFTCLDCIKCLDLLDRIKTNLLKKYPNLTLSDYEKERSRSKSSRATPRKTRVVADTFIEISSDEEPSNVRSHKSRSVDNVKAALKHLTPLKNSRFNIDEFIEDHKLLEQVAFVKLNLSDLSKLDYRKLSKHSRGSGRLKKYRGHSDSESLRDTPSPKPSFFKIKLKINQNKIKLQKISPGKVTKSKAHAKFLSGDKKELVVKILKTNLEKMKEERDQIKEIRTPTKASRKMMSEPDDTIPVSSSKKRKSVTFADVLDTDITDRPYHKDNHDVTPLKSLLKKSMSPTSDLLRNGNGESDDESDTGFKKATVTTGPEEDSDEELDAPKGYVEEIQKHNDDIFNSLKTPTKSTKKTPEKSKDGSDSDSEDDTLKANNKKSSKKDIESKKVTKYNKTESLEINSSDSENNENEEEETNKDKVKSTKVDRRKKTEINTINVSDSDEEVGESETNNKVEDENNLDDINKTENNEKNSSDSDSEINTENEQKEKKSRVDNKGVASTNKKGTDKTYKKSRNLDSDSDSIESSNKIEEEDESEMSFNIPDSEDADDPLRLSLEASKEVNDTESSKTCVDSADRINENEPNDVDSEKDSKEEDEDKIDTEISGKKSIDENIEKNEHSSDIESDAEESNKNSSLVYKSRKRRKSTVDENEEFEEPETKKEKVSEENNLKDVELENQSEDVQTASENTLLGITKEPTSAGAVGNELDELIAKYTNPCAPNLLNDNVLDSQDVGAGSENKESNEPSRGSAEVADEDSKDKEETLGVSDDNTKDDISEVDITIDKNSSVIDKDTVDSKDVDLDILDTFVDDSCRKIIDSSSETFLTCNESPVTSH